MAIIYSKQYRFLDFGLLLIRVGIGVMFMLHGYPKLSGGPAMWAGIGGVMSKIGLGFAPTFWGLLAALAEFGGGLLLVLGLLHRLACAGLLGTMIMATIMHLSKGDGFNDYSHALESAVLFAGLLLTGPGRYSIDAQRAARRAA